MRYLQETREPQVVALHGPPSDKKTEDRKARLRRGPFLLCLIVRKLGQHLGVQVTIAGQYTPPVGRKRLAGYLGHPASSFLYNQRASSHIPRPQLLLPMAVKTTHGHVA